MGLADACLHVCMEGFASLGTTLCGDSSGRRGLSNVADIGVAIAGQRWRSRQDCWRDIGLKPPSGSDSDLTWSQCPGARAAAFRSYMKIFVLKHFVNDDAFWLVSP